MKFLRHLYVQVLIAVVLGSLVGHFYPEFGVALQPLGEAFIKAVKMLIGPIIFSTIVIGIVGILLLTSKGAAAVTGGGFVTLSATLASTHHVPVSGLSLIIGIDRFMSEARAVTNLIGNGVAVIAVAAWEGELDREKARLILAGEASPPAPPL